MQTCEGKMSRVRNDRPVAQKEEVFRDRKWLDKLKEMRCLACGRGGTEGHHVGRKGTGMKEHDYHCVPLCRSCHTKLHAEGEVRFWRRVLTSNTMKDVLQGYARNLWKDRER